MWRFISNEQNEIKSHSEGTEICDDKIKNKKRSMTKKSTKHTLQRNRHKITDDYMEKLFDDSG